MIVVFGSINVDMVVPVERLPRAGETVLGPDYRTVPGGKGANQALAAHRAGARVHMAGCVGDDALAEVALAELRAGGVDLSAVATVPALTGCAFIAVDPHGANQIVVASGANRFARAEQVSDALLGKAGVLLLQQEVPAAENAALVQRARARDCCVVLNAAPAAVIAEEVLAALDWLVVNETEAELTARALGLPVDGIERGTVEAAAHAAAAIARHAGIGVVATLGADGAIAFTADGAWHQEPLRVEAVDTTAAGDAFVGAFAAALDTGADAGEAMRRASVAGALACTIIGAQTSLPDATAIEHALARLAPERRLPAPGE